MQAPEHKQAFPKETNFQEKIRDNKVNFRILHKKPIKPKFNVKRSHVNKEDTVFVTMFLPTLISDAAVKKVFQEFGEVHSVFSGTYRDEEEFNFIRNGKRHIRLTPDGSKQDLPHKVQFHGEQRYFHVMWAEKVVFCKRCSIHHMLKVDCSEVQKEMAVHTEDGITYDTRPIHERLSDVHTESIQSAPQVEGTLNSPDVAITHKERPDIKRQISQPELAQIQSDHYETPKLDIPVTRETDNVSWGETDCIGSPRPRGVTPAVPINNIETPGGHTGGLGHTNTVDPPTHEMTHTSSPNSDPDKVVETTIKDVVTKTLFRKEDVGPS